MKKVVDEDGRLAAVHKEADAELRAADALHEEAQEAFDEAEADLRVKQRWLAAYNGQDEKLRARLVNSAEFTSTTGAKLQEQVQQLWDLLRERSAALKTAKARLDAARQAESGAFYSLWEHRHRIATVEMIRLEVAVSAAMHQERQARNALADRTGALVGSLPIFRTAAAQAFEATDPQSSLCHVIRDAVAVGYLTGGEEWLQGVAWRGPSV